MKNLTTNIEQKHYSNLRVDNTHIDIIEIVMFDSEMQIVHVERENAEALANALTGDYYELKGRCITLEQQLEISIEQTEEVIKMLKDNEQASK